MIALTVKLFSNDKPDGVYETFIAKEYIDCSALMHKYIALNNVTHYQIIDIKGVD